MKGQDNNRLSQENLHRQKREHEKRTGMRAENGPVGDRKSEVSGAGPGWRADGRTTETRPQQGCDNTRVKISPGTQRRVHTCSVARLKVSFFIISIGDGHRLWAFLLKRLISLL